MSRNITVVHPLLSISFHVNSPVNNLTGGDVTLLQLLNSSDILRQTDITKASLVLLSNLCNSEINQAHLGATPEAIQVAVRVCENGRYVYITMI